MPRPPAIAQPSSTERSVCRTSMTIWPLTIAAASATATLDGAGR